MKLFDKIRILRKARGLSQEQLGYSLSRVNKDGISRQTVSDWENGKFEPKLDNIRDLAEVFDVSFDALLDESVDLEDQKVLNAVLNQQPYEKNNETVIEDTVVVDQRRNITFREIVLLMITAYFVLTGAMQIMRYVCSFIEAKSPEYVSPVLFEFAIDFVFLAIFTVAFPFLLRAIFKNKKPTVAMILLIVGTSLLFAFTVITSISSINMVLNKNMKGSSSYSVNGIPTTYEKMVIGNIIRCVISILNTAVFLAASIIVLVSYKKNAAGVRPAAVR